MKKRIPIIIALFASVFIVSAAILTLEDGKNPAASNPNELVFNFEEAVKKIDQKDTDGDGLLDWEEDLWGTSKENKDSDGDKTNDNDEINQGRNPTKKGPDDKIESTLEKTAPNSKTTPERELTPTEKLGRSLFAEYLIAKQGGASFDEEAIQVFTEAMLENTIGGNEFETYGSLDLKVLDEDGEDAAKNYGDAIAQIAFSHKVEAEHEFIIFARFAETKNARELAKLDPIIASYKGILKDALDLSIPKSAADVHIAFLNSLSQTVASLEGMRLATSDEIIELVAIERHKQSAEMAVTALKGIKSYLEESRVFFAQNDAGYRFFSKL